MNQPQIIRNHYSLLLVAVLAIIAFMLLVGDTLVQSGGSYEVTAFSIDGGHGESCGGNFTVAGIMGQPDAGTLTGSTYTLEEGMYPNAASCYVYLPIILKS